MRQLKWIAPLVALGLVLSFGIAKAVDAKPGEAAKGSVAGKVTDSNDKAVEGAIVMFVKATAPKHTEKAEGNPPKRDLPKNAVKTAADGTYTLADVPAGDWIIRATNQVGS